jgi:hypothetical protein
MIKSLIKDFLAKNNHKKSEETSQLAQQIYLSMRYALVSHYILFVLCKCNLLKWFIQRNILEKSATLNEAQLNHIIKSHYDFYANNDSLVDLLFPSE